MLCNASSLFRQEIYTVSVLLMTVCYNKHDYYSEHCLLREKKKSMDRTLVRWVCFCSGRFHTQLGPSESVNLNHFLPYNSSSLRKTMLERIQSDGQRMSSTAVMLTESDTVVLLPKQLLLHYTAFSSLVHPVRSLRTWSGVRGIKIPGFWYRFSASCTASYNCLYIAAITSNARCCTVERWTLLSSKPIWGNSNISGITRNASNLLWNLKKCAHT